MRLALCLLVVLGLACGTPATIVPRAPDLAAVTAADFRLLRFLEGRWSAHPSNGERATFDFRFVGPTGMEVRRSAPPGSAEREATGVLEVVHGRIVYRSGRHRWTAVELRADAVAFDPIEDAPTSFAWTATGEDRLRIVEVFVDPARGGRTITDLARSADG